MADEKLLGTQKLDLKELSTDVAEANKLLKSLGTGVNLDMSDVMKDEIKRQIDQLVNAVKRSGSQTKKTAQSISSDIETVTRETLTYGNKASNALTVIQKGYDQLGRSISETSKNGVLVSKTIVTSDESDIIKRTSTAVSSLATAYRNLAEARKTKDATSEAHWQGEVAQQNSVLAGIQQEIRANTHRAETIRTVNNLLQQQKDLEARSQRASQKLIEESEVEIVKSATNALRELKKAQANLGTANKAGDTGGAQYWQDAINANNLILDQMADQNFQAGLSAKTQESINRVLQERITLQNKAEIKDIASEEKEELAFVNSVKNAVDDLAKSYKNLQQAKDRKDFVSVNHWQNEVNANKANIDSLSKQVNVRQLSAKAQKEINNHLRKAVDLEHDFVSSASKNGTLFDKLAKSAVRLTASFVTMRLIGSMWRSATEFAKEYHDALNEIRMVTGMNSKEAKSLGDDYLQLAKEMKVSSRDIAQAAVEYYRQGQSGDTVTENLEWTIKYAKVASLEFNDAAEIMTAAMNSMDQHAQKVTDVFSYLGDASAAGADEIGKAMQKASASAQEAGVSFEWLGAYIATVSEKTRQAPEVIGTAFNTMMARLHNIKATGFNEEDATRVNDIAKALATLPEPLALINSLTGEWVDMSDIFEGIAKQWDTLSDKQRAYVATTMAGTRQQNMFLTLMDDMAKAGEGASRAYELYAGALNSAGNANEKYTIYQESVAASLDGLKASWEELVNLANGGDIFIGLYDTLSKIIRAFTEGTKAMDGWNIGTVAIISGLGLLVPVVYKTVTAFKTLIGLTKAMTMVSATSTIGLVVAGVSALVGVIATLANGMKKVSQEQKKIDYSSQISSLEGNVDALTALISKYEELSGKVNKTESEYAEMESIISQIKEMAPSYASALTEAQGNITESISITNEALQSQVKLLNELKAAQSHQELQDPDNQKRWTDDYTAYYKNDFSYQKLTGQLSGSSQYDVVGGGFKSATDFQNYVASLYTKEVQKDFEVNYIAAVEDLITSWGYRTQGVDIEKDVQAWGKLYSAFQTGLAKTLLDGSKAQVESNNEVIAGYVQDVVFGSEKYSGATEQQKQRVHNEVTRLLETGSLPEDIIFLGLQAAESVMFGQQSDYYTHQDAVTAITKNIKDKDALQAKINEQWKEQRRTGFTNSPPVYLETFISELASELLSADLSSDDIAMAFDNMKSVFGENLDSYLMDLFQFSPELRAQIVSRWTSDVYGLEEAILNESLKIWQSPPATLTEVNWMEDITNSLLENNKSLPEIEKAYQIFFKHLQAGLISFDDVLSILADGNPGEAFEQKMGQINGVVAALDEAGSVAAETGNKWADYIKSASDGGEDYIKDLSEIYEEMERIAQLQSDLNLVKNADSYIKNAEVGEDAAEMIAAANQRLFDEFGTTETAVIEKFVGIASDSLATGLAYLHEQKLIPGAQTLIDDLAKYCTESGIVISQVLAEQLKDVARQDTKGIKFVTDGYADQLMSELTAQSDGSVDSQMEIAAAISAVTHAIDEGTLSWGSLISAMEDGISTSELFQLAYKDSMPDPAKNQDKWDDYIEKLDEGNAEDQLSVMKSVKEEAQSTAESIADLYRVTYGSDSEAYKRLYEKYGTTSLSMLKTYIETEKRALEEGAKLLTDAGHDVMSGYMREGDFSSLDVMIERMTDAIRKQTGDANAAVPEGMVETLTKDAESAEHLTAVMWLLTEALETGYLSLEKIQTAMADGFNMEEAWNLFNEASMLKAVDQLKDFASSIDDEERLSFFETLFGTEGFEIDEAAYNSFLSVLSALEKESAGAGEDIRKNLELDEDVWKDIVDGGEMAADTIKAIQKQTQKLKLKKMEEAGKIMEDTAEAFELAEKGGVGYQEKVIELHESISDLQNAQAAYNIVSNTSLKGTSEYADALSSLADYVGMDATLLENNLGLALNKITADANIAQATISALANALYAVAGSSFDPSSWSSGLIVLGADASAAEQNIASMINTMLQAAGARIAATLNKDGTAASINVTGLGNSAYRPSGGGSRGGGGGGGKKNDSTSEATKLLDRMADAIDKIAKKMEALDSIMSKYDTEGYITGMINALELENELIEEQIELQKENQKVIDERLATLYVDLSKQAKGSTKYEQLLEEIEKLEDAYNEYTVAILENEAALSANKKEMKEHRESIRDMEIDIREEILSAIEDRIEREEEALDARIDMEEEILDAIIRRHEKERDQILETTEMQIDALEREKDALDEALDARKRAAEEEDKRLELAELEAQYQRIAADPTRAKEALKLQKQIKELRDDIAWDKAEKEVDSQKEALDQQITSLEDYAEYVEKYYDDLLENPRNFLNEVNQILNMSHEQIIAWLKSNSEEYANSTDSVRKDFESGWRDTLNTMHGITITHWAEVESIIQQGDEAIIQFLKENSQDYREAGRLQAEAYVDAWREKLDLLKKAYEDIVPELPAQKETPDSALQGSGTSSSSSQRTYYGGYDASGEWKSGYGATKSDAIYLANKKGIVNPKFSTSPVSKPASTTSTTSGGSSGSSSNIPNTQYKPVQFATGGMADFTGPAWLDGSPSAPERVLSPQQTKLFEALVTSLQKATTLSVPSLPAIAAPEKNGQGSYSFGDIVVNVEKLESDEDYEEMAKRVGEVILRQMNRGTYVGGIRHSF